MIAVSPANSQLPFLLFDGEFEGTFETKLTWGLGRGVNRTLPLLLQTAIELASGLAYLDGLYRPFAPVGPDDFVVLCRNGRITISFDPDAAPVDNKRTGLPVTMLDIFHRLCKKTFDAALKGFFMSPDSACINAHHWRGNNRPANCPCEEVEDYQESVLDDLQIPEDWFYRVFPSMPKPPQPFRQHDLVCGAHASGTKMTLELLSHQLQLFLRRPFQILLSNLQSKNLVLRHHTPQNHSATDHAMDRHFTRSGIVVSTRPVHDRIYISYSSKRLLIYITFFYFQSEDGNQLVAGA
ncbi:hypothetical protein GALMADRAFT_282704, partial [Galerina marginata CBS 339.88]